VKRLRKGKLAKRKAPSLRSPSREPPPWREERGLRWASRHSLKPPLAGTFAEKLRTETRERVARVLLAEPLTLLFEVVSPQAPVPARYGRPALFLIAARQTEAREHLEALREDLKEV
jgi:hypothetical protein